MQGQGVKQQKGAKTIRAALSSAGLPSGALRPARHLVFTRGLCTRQHKQRRARDEREERLCALAATHAARVRALETAGIVRRAKAEATGARVQTAAPTQLRNALHRVRVSQFYELAHCAVATVTAQPRVQDVGA